METELVILAALIVIFIVSFCGLLQKIRKSYENDREHTARVTDLTAHRVSLTEIYVNPTFHNHEISDNSQNNTGVFPSNPPPYSENFYDLPPKYEDIIKAENFNVSIDVSANNTRQT